MITKIGKKLAEDEKKSIGESLGVGLAGGTVPALAAQMAVGAASVPLVYRQLLSGKKSADLSKEESRRLIKEMLGAKKVPINEPVMPAMSHFDPNKQVVVAPKNSYVLAHELGHATGLLGKERTLGRTLGFLTHGVGGPLIAPIIRGIESAQTAYNRKKGYSEKDDSEALSRLSAATQVGTAAQLAEEAQASIRGLRAIGKIQGRAGVLRAAKVLGPAFGTYVLGAIGSHGIAPWVGRHIGEAID